MKCSELEVARSASLRFEANNVTRPRPRTGREAWAELSFSPCRSEIAHAYLVAPTAPTAGPAAAVTAAARAAAATILARLCFVDRQRASANLLTAQSLDGVLRLLIVAHLHEAEALGATGVPVHDD